MSDLTIRDRIGIRWSQLLSWYYAGYNWSMNIRIKRQMRRDNQEMEHMETEELYVRMGRKVLELTIQAHPIKAAALKPALHNDMVCAKVGKDYEAKVAASDDLKLKEEYNMIRANLN
jgi:hypothetical protein